jgi:hypothetical protein
MIERAGGVERHLHDLAFQLIEHTPVHADQQRITDAFADIPRMGANQTALDHFLAISKQVFQISCRRDHSARLVHQVTPTCCRTLRSVFYRANAQSSLPIWRGRSGGRKLFMNSTYFVGASQRNSPSGAAKPPPTKTP